MRQILFILPIALLMLLPAVLLLVLVCRALLAYIRSKKIREEKNAVKRSLEEALREHRTQRQMTQEFVAESIGVSRQAVSKWEKGLSDPSTSNLLALARLYGVSAEELLAAVETHGMLGECSRLECSSATSITLHYGIYRIKLPRGGDYDYYVRLALKALEMGLSSGKMQEGQSGLLDLTVTENRARFIPDH